MKKKKTVNKKPIAVLISDVHYTLNTLQVANSAFRSAIDKAVELGVPLIDGGDITNDKAIIRAEIANTLIDTMKYANSKGLFPILLVGNHSLINEKGKEHALHFLEPYTRVVSSPVYMPGLGGLIPYQSKSSDFLEAVKQFPKGSIVIGHQGTIGGQLGHYVKDESAFDPKLVKDWKVFLGHYHAHYSLQSTISIGNPYTLTLWGVQRTAIRVTYFCIATQSFDRVVLGLRKHVVVEQSIDQPLAPLCNIGTNDLVWVKLKGPKSEIALRPKDDVGKKLGLTNFKLDKIYTDSIEVVHRADNMSSHDLLDSLIDAGKDSDQTKKDLKLLWRDLIK